MAEALPLFPLSAKVRVLRGVGPVFAEAFEGAGIATLRDLLWSLPHRYVEMRRMDPTALDPRRTLVRLPPLIKGYLRLGGFVGDGAVIDTQFNTTDVAIVVRTDLVTERYLRHYERTAGSED